jgi:hypothetical protein
MGFQKNNHTPKGNFSDNQNYPKEEDIYNTDFEEEDIDPENTSENKDRIAIYNRNKNNEKDFKDDFTGGDLDIPGTELDDEQEKIGSEDEENNYYSFGDDDNN